MEKFPLSTSGLQDLLNEIYSLPDTDLQQQAQSIASDFRGWIGNHFVLDQDQQAFLSSVDERFVQKAGAECSSFFSARLPIFLLKEAQSPGTSTLDRGKLLDLDKKTSLNYSKDGGYRSSQALIFTISYSKVA